MFHNHASSKINELIMTKMQAKIFAKKNITLNSILQNYAFGKLKRNFASKRNSSILLPPNDGWVHF